MGFLRTESIDCCASGCVACRIRFRRVIARPPIAMRSPSCRPSFPSLDQPVTGRIFFEEVIRENLGLGRPSQVSLVSDRKVIRRTPGRFRTPVITDGVVPSLHVDYKKSHIKQYHKQGQALRTETIDFAAIPSLNPRAGTRPLGVCDPPGEHHRGRQLRHRQDPYRSRAWRISALAAWACRPMRPKPRGVSMRSSSASLARNIG
jgi:hypothetical protein